MWEILLELFGPLLLDTVSGMRKPKGDVPKINAEAKAQFRAGRYAEAEVLYRKALAIRQAHFGEKHRSSGYYLSHLGVTVQRQNRYDEADVMFQSALKVYKEVEGPNSLNVAHQLGNLSELRLSQKSYREAENYLTRAIALYKQLPQPETWYVLLRQKSLAWANYYQEHFDQAKALAERVRVGFEQIHETDNHYYVDCIDLLCCLNAKRRYRDGFIPALRLVKEKRELLGLTDDLLYAVWLGFLGAVLIGKKQLAEAEPLLVQAIALKRKLKQTESDGFIVNLIELGQLYNLQTRYDRAEPLLYEGLGLSRRLVSSDSKLYRLMLVTASRCHYYQDRAEDTIHLCEEYLELYSKVQEDEVKMMLSCRVMLGRMYGRLQRYWQAEAQLTEAQTICAAKWGENSPQYASIIAYVGEWNHMQGRDSAALTLVMQALQIFADVPNTGSRAWLTARKIAAEVLESRGQWSEAEPYRQEVCKPGSDSEDTLFCPL